MPSTSTLLRFSLGSALLAAASLSQGCSLHPGYLAPSNYDLVKSTPTIVLAKAVAADPGDRAKPWERPPTVSFDVVAVVKGARPDKAVAVFGDATRYDGPSDPNSFAETRPGSGRGACNAHDYRIGTTYLLFLGGSPDGPHGMVGGPPYTRINEEASEGSPWLAAVRHYVRIAALNNAAAERKALLALQAQAKAQAGDPRYPPALDADIENHFQAPNPRMSYAELLAIYNRANRDADMRAAALWAMTHPPKPEARTLFASLVRSGGWRSQAQPTVEFVSRTRDHDLAARLLLELPSAADADLRRSILFAATQAAGVSELPNMLRAARSANKEELRDLAPWFVKHPSAAGTALLRRALTEPYEKDRKLAFALASLGDTDVLAWGQRRADVKHKDRWMGFHVFALSPLPLADELARRTIHQGDAEDIGSLVDGYEESTNPHLWDRLADVISLTPRPEPVNIALRRILRTRADAGDARAAALLKTMAASSKGRPN
jgi:hypothetical protein